MLRRDNMDLDDEELEATRVMNGTNKKKSKNPKCKYCGEEFIQNKKGRKRDYCSKEECIRQAKNETQRKWYSNKLQALQGVKTRIIEQKEEKKVVYCSTDRAINSVNNEDFSDVIELARELGAIRFKITEKIKELSPKQSFFDKQDDIFLHQIENLAKKDEVYEEEVLEIVREYFNKRPNRRVVKDKQEMLKHLIQGLISNPNQYVVEFLKNRDNRTYNPKIKEEELGTKGK